MPHRPTGPLSPATIRSTDASTGSAAHGAGNPGEDRTTNALTTMPASPSSDIGPRARPNTVASPGKLAAATATSAPAPSSQARPGEEKYAGVGLWLVCCTAYANDATLPAAITASRASFAVRFDSHRPATVRTIRMATGQTR